MGAAVSAALAEAATVSLWAVSRVGGNRAVQRGGMGIRLATTPNEAGVVIAAMLCQPATGSSSSSATSMMPPSHISGDAFGSTSGVSRHYPQPMLFEVSASLPVADGVCLTPGLVVSCCQRGGPLIGALALHSSWHF